MIRSSRVFPGSICSGKRASGEICATSTHVLHALGLRNGVRLRRREVSNCACLCPLYPHRFCAQFSLTLRGHGFTSTWFLSKMISTCNVTVA